MAGILIIVSGAINAYLNLESYSLQLIGSYPPGTSLLATLIYLNAISGTITIGIAVMIAGKVLHAYLRRDYHIWYYISALLMTPPALWVTLDLTTRYALSIFTVSDIEVFQKLLLGILDVGLAVLAGGAYLRGKVKGWMNVENGRRTQKVSAKA